jgi:hypothetical protein
MLEKFWNFVKYNNAAIIIIVLIFVVGTGAFASETGREIIGYKTDRIEGADNTLLLQADLENLKMDFSISDVSSDDNLYYVKYTFIDLVKTADAWEYQMKERELKLSKSRVEGDLGEEIAKELDEMRTARLKELADEKIKAQENGETKRTRVVEYSGLIGKVLDAAGAVIPDYEPVVKKEIPSPVPRIALRMVGGAAVEDDIATGTADNITEIYRKYLDERDPDRDNVFGEMDNCPAVANPDQADLDSNGIGDACETESSQADGQAGADANPAEAVEPQAGDPGNASGAATGDGSAETASSSVQADTASPVNGENEDAESVSSQNVEVVELN